MQQKKENGVTWNLQYLQTEANLMVMIEVHMYEYIVSHIKVFKWLGWLPSNPSLRWSRPR